MNRVVAVVGMAGSGKSEASSVFIEHGYGKVRFGDITDREVARRGLPLSEANERQAREELRKKHGMAAYAILSLPEIENLLEKSNVVVDGLYSWDEYKLLKERFGDNFKLAAVWASPETRYQRLASRKVRPLSRAEAASRDNAEIEKSQKGGPIAMADFTIINEGKIARLKAQAERIIRELK